MDEHPSSAKPMFKMNSKREVLVAHSNSINYENIEEYILQIQVTDVSGLSAIKILFLQSKFYDLESRDIGEPFDYINCVGVLHHLPDPLIGLKILNNLLESGGGINMMVYATVGRTGIYHVREMARLLSLSRVESNEIATVDDAKIVLESLPKTNWFAKNSLARGSQEMQHMGDVGLADLIMNPCDIAMSITEVSTFAQNAGMRILTPIRPELYKPKGSPELLDKLNKLSWIEKAQYY